MGQGGEILVRWLCIYLALWYLGKAIFCISNKRILHGVYCEAIKGGLCPNIFLKPFDHCAIEPVMRKEGHTF